jgi:hypothetical protein
MAESWMAEFTAKGDGDWMAEFTRAQPEGPTWQERAGSALRGAAQSITFGGADELRGAVRGGLRKLEGEEYGPAYAEEVARAREEDKRLAAKAPGANLAGAVGGALLTAPLLPGATATTLPRLVAQGARVGAASGAAQGFGAGEGGFKERLSSAGQGALMGAGVGAVAAPVLRLGTEAVGGLLGRRPQTEARRLLQGAFQEEGIDPVALIRQANAAGAKDVTLADVSRRGREFARDVGAAPNPSQTAVREFFGRRQAGEFVPGQGQVGGQMNRLTGTLRDLTGVAGRRAVQTLDAIEAERRTVAGPLFRQAEQFNTTASPELAQLWGKLIQTDAGKGALATTRKLWSNEFPGQRFPLSDPRNLSAVPDMRIFKLFKESLDGEVDRLYRDPRANKALAGSAKALRNELRDTLRTVNPTYGQALDAFAGRKAMEEALERGRAILRTDADEAAQEFAGLGASEQEMFRVGAVSSIVDKLRGKAPTEMADFTNELRKPDVHRRVAMLLPDDATREQFDRLLMAESQQSITANTFGNSQTQPRQEVAKEVGRGRAVLEFLQSIPTSLSGALLRVGAAASDKLRGVDVAARRGELGRMLTATDADAARLAEELARMRTAAPLRSATPGGLLGGAVGPGMMPPGTVDRGFDLLGRR